MEREHTLLDRIREFDEMLRQLAEQISFREEHGLTAEEIRELNVEYLAPGNIMLEHVNAALNQWRALADPWAELDELEEENERWQLRLERLERRWVHVRDSILNPSIEQTGRLDTMTSELRTYLREELKYPPEAWKDPTVYFVEFGDSSVDMRLAYFIDDGRLEHFKRRTRVAREIGFTILKRFEELGIEVPYPQLEVFYKGP
jgi:small-conductance mechanosensitive channel